MLQEKTDRARLFGTDLFAPSSFEMLLGLYLAKLDQRDILVSKIGEDCGIPQSTALRWLPDLEQSGLVVRQFNPAREKSYFLCLTEKALAAMNDYLESRLH